MTKRLAFFLSFAPVGLWGQIQLTVNSTGTPLAAYRAFFHHVQYLQSESQKAAPSESVELQSWHQKHIGLTLQEAIQVKQVAAIHVAAIDAIETQASQIIQKQRNQFPSGKLASSNSAPPPPPALAQLQKQRDDLTTVHMQTLQAALGPDSFAKVDSWIKANFSQGKSRVSRVHPAQTGAQPRTGVQQ